LDGANNQPLAVVGAGSWGTALGVLLAQQGHEVRLWGRDAVAIAAMAQARTNQHYLPCVELPPSLTPIADLREATAGAGDVLIVVPSHAFAEVVAALAGIRPDLRALAWASKGFEPQTGRFLDEVVVDYFGSRCARALLSGPTFAAEVARGLPTAVTLAGTDEAFTQRLAQRFRGSSFRVYTSTDLIGVQVAGGVKNVLAIAAGIADGLGFGANTRAALITRGLAELTRLGLRLGGRAETFSGLAALGDLMLTCSDDQSRNRRFGLALAAGASVDDAVLQVGQVVEGLRNTREVIRLAARNRVEMPIAEQVHRVLFEQCSPREAVQALLARELKAEGA
jgi:glycerol-3-phosphate dehydrogenase (NAD(P)+)